MRSLFTSILRLRTTRVAALFLSVSAIAMGGFFISLAHATVNTITLTAPNGGEFWRGTSNITWTANASSTDSISILLSKDGDTNHFNTLIANGITATNNNYPWVTTQTSGLPLADGSTYRIEVTDGSTGIAYSSNVFTVDNTAPTTTLATSTMPDGLSGWYKTAPVITLTCTDNLSGCSNINYAWYNATSGAVVVATTTTTGAVVAPQGDNLLVYYSEDNAVDKDGAHNIEAAHSAEFKVDTVAPTISSYTLNGTTNDVYFNPAHASTTIALTASEPVTWNTVRIESVSSPSIYRDFNPSLDGQATTTVVWDGKIPSSGPVAADGAYQLFYTITDLAGNKTGPVAGPLTPAQIHIDTTAPTMTLTSPVADAVYKGSGNTTTDMSALSFTSSDTNPLTYTYSIDGAATTSPAAANNDGTTALTSAISGLSDGRHTIVVTVTDGAGNSVSSAPVSFVFDNNNTLTVSGTPADHADFSSIVGAVAKATAGDTIDIFPGTYTENVNVNKSLTLQSHSGATGTTIHGLVSVVSDAVTVKNLTLTNPSGNYAVTIAGNSNVSITGNTVTDVGTSASGNIHSIIWEDGASDASSLTITKNTITNIGNTTVGGSTSGIGILDSNGTAILSSVTIDGNTINNINARPGKGAYGMLLNHATSGIGAVSGATISNNVISGLTGGWVTAIGLEGNTPGALVEHNTISGLTSAATVGVHVEQNADATSVTIQYNSFAKDIVAGVLNSTTATTTAINNWWGSKEGPTYAGNPHGDGAGVSNFVSFVPWCTDASCATLDSSAPTAVLTGTPNLLTNATTINVTVGATGDVAYYSYRLDGGAWSAETGVSTTIASSSLADGAHTLDVLGRDQSGNWQTVPTTYSWTIDTVPPVVAEVTPVTTPTATTTPSYVFSTTKLGTITYGGGCTSTLAPAATTTGDVAITFDHLADGLYNACTITVTDSAGNVSNVLAVTPFRIDTTAPVVDAGSNKNVHAPVLQHATATDTDGSGVVTYSWAQQGGPGTVTFSPGNAADTTISASADGVYTLRLFATDAAGNVGHADMTLTWDTHAPTVTAPAAITMEATAALTPLTLTPATAIDALDPAPVVTSDAPATFPVGITTVTWTATDAAGNSATATQTVTITDTTKPVIASHSDETAEATSASGAQVSYTLPVATDIVDGTDTVTCLPSSGSLFPLGVTTVTCTAADVAGNAAVPVTFTVTVHDTTAPVIAAHANKQVVADQLGGATVTYTAPDTTDAVDGTLPADCLPASGTVFPMGATTVNCTKTDAAGNIATPTSFTVTVVPGALTQVGISASPTSLTTADTSTITVAAQDQYGNTITTDNSTKVVLSTDGSGSLGDTILTVANGVQTTTLASSLPGTVHVNAASGLLIPNVVAVTFTGAAVPDTTPPVITNVQSTNISTSTVQITWTTNENATSQVAHGTTSGYGSSTVIDPTLTASHSVLLSGLTPNTQYHFRVKSADAATNLATSGDNTFTTVVDDTSAVLAVTGIDGTKTYATADNTFDNGFRWTFHMTVPTAETHLAMKFSDFVSGTNTIPASNLRFYSAQSSDATASTSAMAITAPNTYSNPITLSSDLNPVAAGRQIEVTVEMRVPTGTAGGSYSASYGVQSN